MCQTGIYDCPDPTDNRSEQITAGPESLTHSDLQSIGVPGPSLLIIVKIFIMMMMAKIVRWDRVEDLLAYGILMLGLLVLPTSLVTGRYNH